MSKTESSAPAFPLASEELSDRFYEGVGMETGLTKREYYSGLFTQAIVSSVKFEEERGNFHTYDKYDVASICGEGVRLADALIAELNKEESNE